MKVVPAEAHDIDGEFPEARLVSGLEVVHANHRPALVLEVACRGPQYERSGQEDMIYLALSPPAAMQLSRLLRRSVKSYLRSQPDQENQT